MKVIKLSSEHVNTVRPLFEGPNFMGVDSTTNYFIDSTENFVDFYHEAFCHAYLTNLTNYQSFAVLDDNDTIECLIAFYESIDDASWYWTQIRSRGNKHAIRLCLDSVIDYNENNNRFKFYSMFPSKYIELYRRLAFSETNRERYDSFDEYLVEPRTQCPFSLAWHILYNRTLVPVETVVRCTYLKRQYRNTVPNLGKL